MPRENSTIVIIFLPTSNEPIILLENKHPQTEAVLGI